MSGQREKREALSWQQAQALMRDLAEDVIGPILQDIDVGRTPSTPSVWRLRAGLSRLRRVYAWGKADRARLVEALEHASQKPEASEIVQPRTWLRARVRSHPPRDE